MRLATSRDHVSDVYREREALAVPGDGEIEDEDE